MSERREPDAVDLFLGDVAPDADAAEATSRFIEAYKERPGYKRELAEARRILDGLGVRPGDHGMPDAAALLDHWHACVARLKASPPDEALESAKTRRK